MGPTRYNTTYISSNCNQTPTIVDWGKNNLICYGACNAVFIYDPNYGSGGKVLHTLAAHTMRINSVKWITGPQVSSETELVSGSTDSFVIVWTLREGQYVGAKLEGHTSNVNIVEGLYKNEGHTETLVVSVSMDSSVKIWYRRKAEDSFQLIQNLDLGYNICVGMRLSFLPGSNEFILACSLDNSKINIFTEKDCDQLAFEKAAQLTGHEDWVRGLDFKHEGEDLILASCSQDTFIRLWRITPKDGNKGNFAGIKTEKSVIQTKHKVYSVYLESILTGHEGWVYSVNWSPTSMQLLSASIDKSMVLWEYDTEAGLWLDKMRVGEVGGNTLGFYGGLFDSQGQKIIAHSYHGAFHIWRYSEKTCEWTPCVGVGGHFGEVVDCAWEPHGRFLYSCSQDQTTRIHAPWRDGDKEVTWHEIARPQVHGFDMSSLAVISSYRFASSAEEKVIRTFEAPVNFIDNFRRICKIENDKEGDIVCAKNHVGPKGASVPSLGLSNKAVYNDDNMENIAPTDNRNLYPEESHFVATDLAEPPTEETLLQNTLWPETQKLYGHGYEVYSLAASPDGNYLASACKSTKPEHSAVLLWDTSNWQLVQKLMSHTLTVVQLQFSPDSQHLLSVSRDRRWSMFSRSGDQFELVATTDKSTGIHTRIVWCCAWTHDSKYFATGSRDGRVVIWTEKLDKEGTSLLDRCEPVSKSLSYRSDAVTALAFAPVLVSGKYLMAVGLESGLIHLYSGLEPLVEVLKLSKSEAHHLTVKRLAFRPTPGTAGGTQDENVLQLASCSTDNCVKVYSIYLDRLL